MYRLGTARYPQVAESPGEDRGRTGLAYPKMGRKLLQVNDLRIVRVRVAAESEDVTAGIERAFMGTSPECGRPDAGSGRSAVGLEE